MVTTSSAPQGNRYAPCDPDDFLDTDYDLKAWTNRILQHGEDGTSMDQLASNVTLKLHLLAQDIASKIDQIADEAVRQAPRVLHDVNGLTKELANMQSQYQHTRAAMTDAQTTTFTAFSNLLKLDAVKSRIEATRLALKEAENWSTLQSEMQAIFVSDDYEKASARLQEAQRSLVLLANSPDYKDKMELLSKLQSELERIVTTHLITALNEHDSERIRTFYTVFARINREQEFLNHYYNARKKILLTIWAQSVVRAPQGHDPDSIDGSLDWLERFYHEANSILSKEAVWIKDILPSTWKDVLKALVQRIFTALRPGQGDRLRELVGVARLPALTAAYTLAVTFSRDVEKLLLLEDAQAAGVDDSQASGVSAFLKGTKGAGDGEDQLAWLAVVFEGYLALQQTYPQLEKQYLATILQTAPILSVPSDASELGSMMSSHFTKFLANADKALMRCKVFTLSFASAELVPVLNDFLIQTLGNYSDLLARLHEESQQSNKGSPMERTGSRTNLYEEDSLGDEWAHFQVGLRFLGFCVKTRSDVSSLEQRFIRDGVLFASARLSMADAESTKGLLAKSSLESTTSLALLKQSSLNSYKLHDLIRACGDKEGVRVSTESSPGLIFGPSLDYIVQMVARAQRLVFDCMFSPVAQFLTPLASIDVWSGGPQTTPTPFDLNMPQFSLSPLPYISRIGEHLLSLPQQLELYVDDPALGSSLETLPHLDPADLGKDSPGHKSPPPSGEPQHESSTLEEEDPENAEVVHLWIKSVCRGTMSMYSQHILRIPKLSDHGARQLATDIRYLDNVFAAMDVEATQRLKRIVGMLELEHAQFKAALAWRTQDDNSAPPESLTGIDAAFLFKDTDLSKRIATIRKIA